MLSEAAKNGHLALLQWLLPVVGTSVSLVVLLTDAAMHGHLELVQWLDGRLGDLVGPFNSHYQFLGTSLLKAVQNGHLAVAKYLVCQGHQIIARRKKQLPRYARNGNLEMIQWLHTQHLTDGTTGWVNAAAPLGHLHIVQWVYANVPGDIRSPDAMDRAAHNGFLEVLQLVHANPNSGCTASAMNGAAANGHLDIVKWLHANRAEGCTTTAMDSAAASGHLDIVKWLHTNRGEGCTTYAIDRAANSGHLEIVRWLHAHRTEGCTASAMDGAAANGHLDTVKWLHTNRTEGCTVLAMDSAAGNGHLEVVKWLHENRTEGCTTVAMDQAAWRGHLDVVKWLHENRTEGCTAAAMHRTNSLEVLRWLHERRPEGCSNDAMTHAVFADNFEKLLFLREKNIVAYNPQAITWAISNLSFEIFRWLCANYLDSTGEETAKREARTSCRAEAWSMFFQFQADSNPRA
ncbi:hypothetical protein PybrP1_003935 [[Pythium] brassicae (nom. inval.)]|nr:hypothetical protein PybrP1_003935 [[Pythium] brassicae (nom. inval.)]